MASETRSKRKGSRSSTDGTSKPEQKPAIKIDEQRQKAAKLDEVKVNLSGKTEATSREDQNNSSSKNGDALYKNTLSEQSSTMRPDELKHRLNASKSTEDTKQRHKAKDDQRDGSSTLSKEKTNIARSVIEYEENLAITRDSLNDVEEYKATCKNIEKLVTEINQLKKEEENPSQHELLQQKRLDAMLLTTNLKKLNRLAQIRGHKAKESTREVKKKVDLLHLDLQNLLYEVMHIKKEIQKCVNFSSKDEEIDLVDVDKFYDEAPVEISKPEVTKNDKHQQMLARLDYELKRRKELSVQKSQYLEQKKKTETELHQKSDYLSNLKPRLDQIIKVTLPVQQYMGLPIEAERLLFEKAQYLPRPLYVLYIQAKAFKDVCDKHMSVDITGDKQIAMTEFNDEQLETEVSDDSDSEITDVGESDEKRGRKGNKDGKVARMEVRQSRLLKMHPLKVVVTLKHQEKYEITLQFSHLPNFHINTVKVNLKVDDVSLENSFLLTSDVLLNDLLTKDSGKQSPNSANQYQLDKLQMEDFSMHVPKLGRPYYWVQWICGMNYLPAQDIRSHLPEPSLSVKHFQSVMKSIRGRIEARLSLQSQLSKLEQLSIPNVLKEEKNSPKTVCVLSSWKTIYFEDILKYPSAKELTDFGLMTADCMFFSAQLNREEILNVGVVIHGDYPRETPLVLLQKENSNSTIMADADLMCMERELNAYTNELLRSCDSVVILSAVLKKLQVCFDLYVETGPRKAVKEKLYTRKTRGRDRNRPYVYHADGYFVHR